MQQSVNAARSMNPQNSAVNTVSSVSTHSSSKPTKPKHHHGSSDRSRPTRQQNKCHRCNGPHNPSQCKFKSVTCYKCQKVGHIAKACFSKTQPQSEHQHNHHKLRQPQHFVEIADDSDSASPSFKLFAISGSDYPPFTVPIVINNKTIFFSWTRVLRRL